MKRRGKRRWPKNKKEKKEYFLIAYDGSLNGRKVLINLCFIEVPSAREPDSMLLNLSNLLYEKRGKNQELGPKNGYKSSGWLHVFYAEKGSLTDDTLLIQIDTRDLGDLYKVLRVPLKQEILKKVRIEKKPEAIKIKNPFRKITKEVNYAES